MTETKSKTDATDPAATYWASLEKGSFEFQRCDGCGHAWLPPRSECPKCWAARWQWQRASGKGRLVSFVIFHTAFDEAFEKRLPYNVAVVELAEGPRLITNIVNLTQYKDTALDRAVSLVIERDMNKALPRFKIT